MYIFELETVFMSLEGESALKILFGDRFMREVTNQGLLNPHPYTTSGFEMVAPRTSVSTVSLPQNDLDTIAGNTTTVERNTCSHPPVSSRRVVRAVGDLPEIYVLPLGKFYTLPFIVCACITKVDKLLHLLFSNTHIHLYIVMSCIVGNTCTHPPPNVGFTETSRRIIPAIGNLP